jgi:uncharacterized protein YecE (DUF72 family)
VAGTIRVGISGWSYPRWRGVFYPTGLPRRAELGYVAERMPTAEINGSFYSLQRPSSYRSWREQTPDGFVFAVKGGRFLTHMKRLRGIGTPLANFFASGPLVLGPKLGPVLWQLPPTMSFDAALLSDFLDRLPRSTGEAAWLARRHDERLAGRAHAYADDDRPLRHALEVRHGSFRSPRFLDLLREQQVAVVVADAAGGWPTIREITADFGYVRLHGHTQRYVSGYSDASIERWAGAVRGWAQAGHDVYVYFDNDAKVRAPFDALSLASKLG